jgi:hypothetical protein
MRSPCRSTSRRRTLRRLLGMASPANGNIQLPAGERRSRATSWCWTWASASLFFGNDSVIMDLCPYLWYICPPRFCFINLITTNYLIIFSLVKHLPIVHFFVTQF